MNIYPFRLENGKEVMWPRLYLYTNGGNDQIWNSYVGVYNISEENSDILRHLYANIMETNSTEDE